MTRRKPARHHKPTRDVRPGDRPLRAFARSEVAARCEAALTARDGVAVAHAVHELWMRGEIGLQVERLLERAWASASPTLPAWLPMRYVEWLPLAYDVAARLQPSTRGRYNVYLVLLDYADSRADPHGVYVGMSHYSPAERFDQHKAGIRAAGSVLRRGLEVLEGPTLHLRGLARAEAARFEAALAASLRDAGIFVQGGH